MASVILVSPSGVEKSVTTTREFNNLVYNQGWRPKTGSVAANYDTVLGSPATISSAPYEAVRVGDLQGAGTRVGDAVRDQLLARWLPFDTVQAGELRVSPDGSIIRRNANGTTRAFFDATEIALWTVGSSAGGGPHTHDDRYFTEAETTSAISTAVAGKAATVHTHDDRYYTEAEITTFLQGKANLTHTHTPAEITALAEFIQDLVDTMFVAGANVTKTYDDTAGTLTIASTGAAGVGTDPEAVRDLIGTTLVAGTGITITVNDVGDTVTIATTAVPTTRTITTTGGLVGGGDLSANRTISITFGNTAGTAVEGNDARLSNARTPTAHTHLAADVTDLTPLATSARFADLVQVPIFREDIYWDGVGTAPLRPATTRRVDWTVPASNQPTSGGTTGGGAYATAPGDRIFAYTTT